jgi:hypothetical protein
VSSAHDGGRHVPPRARTAAALLLIYAALVLLNALVWQLGAAESRPIEFFRAGVRILGVVLIAVGLLRGARWAWLLGVVFAGFWLLMGVLSAAALFAGSAGRGVSLFTAALLVAAVAVLAAGWILLLTREVRDAYRST